MHAYASVCTGGMQASMETRAIRSLLKLELQTAVSHPGGAGN